ncbi:LAMI_0H14466g1_1 [Lachancea mirantina]|uniref:LAMI_0H14466g1_1 n=1 Tax=Lachancea mirantina TaxID=1230905 RepID=A0A1G4KIE0_9SACH|nr:LAMI_0H14466g1_1 [Lachancea mirantina]
MSEPVTENITTSTDAELSIETPPSSVGEENLGKEAENTEPEAAEKPLPTKADFPALGSGAFYAASPKVSWGPNMKTPVTPASSSRSPTPSSALSAKPARSKTIQEAFTLDLQSQLSISKVEFSRIVQHVKQAHDVSVESTLSKNSRTFLIFGIPDKVKAARREIVKKLTKPVSTTIQVPSKTRAAIIGAGGRKIREISEPLDVKIEIGKTVLEDSFDPDLDDYLVNVTINGDLESVKIAQAKILAIVKEETKSITALLDVETNLRAFVHLDGSKNDVAVNYNEKEGKITISGERDLAKATKLDIQKYLQQLNSAIQKKTVQIPNKFQILIDTTEIKNKFGVVVKLPTDGSENVLFMGTEEGIDGALLFARSSSKKYVVESLEISKAHGKNISHAKNVALYFDKYNVLNSLQEKFPFVKITLPSPDELIRNDSVSVMVTSTTEHSSDLKAVRKEIINLVNDLTVSQIMEISDLDNELFHDDIKRILQKNEDKARFVQLGELYPDSDIIILIAQISDDEFRPSEDELEALLKEANGSLDSIREEQKKLTLVVEDLDEEIQDSLLSISAVTRKLLEQDISSEDGHVQIKLHKPTKGQITFRGDENSVKLVSKALKSIRDTFSEKSKLSFTIPTNSVSRIIGTKGASLAAVREGFGCQIDVSQESENNSNEVTVIGLLFNAEHAKAHVMAEAKKWADVTSKELLVPAKYQGRMIGAGGANCNRLQEKYSVHIKFPDSRESETVIVRGPSRGVNKAYEELKALLDFEIENGHQTVITVPAEAVSRIIGKNGETINDIRASFGVELEFPEKVPQSAAKNVKVQLEITGSRPAIKEATQKIEKIVKEVSDNVTESVAVDPSYIKDIVGAGGRVLKEIVSKAGGDEFRNTSVEVPEAGSGKNAIVVQGPKTFVISVVKDIKAIIDEKEKSVTKELDVVPERKGALIGPGGYVRRQLEKEFNVRLFVPNGDDNISKVTVTGLPANVEACEKKIFSEIIRDNFDLEVKIPAKYQEFVSDRGTFIQKLRSDFFVNVKFGNMNRFANKVGRPAFSIPIDSVKGSAEEKVKFTKGSIPQVSKENVSDLFIPWRLSYEPVDLSDILNEEGEQKTETKSKESVLREVTELINQRLQEAPNATSLGYVWTSKPQNFRRLVGPQGSNIKRIRDATGAIIEVPKKAEKINDVVYIKGSEDNVVKAAEMIMKKLDY